MMNLMTEAATDMPDARMCMSDEEIEFKNTRARAHTHTHLFISRNTWKLSVHVPFLPWCHRDLYVSVSGNMQAQATQINISVLLGRIFQNITMPLLSHADRDEGQDGQKAQLLYSSAPLVFNRIR